MNRRRFLSFGSIVFGSFLAGCTSDSKTPTIVNRPKIASVSTSLPDGVSAEVNLVSNNHTEKPLQFTIQLKNESDTDYVYGEGREPFFIGAKSGSFGLYPSKMYSSPKSYHFDADAGVWVASEGFMQTMEYQIGELNSEESDSKSVVLLHEYVGEKQSVESYPNELLFSAEFKIAESQEELLAKNGGQTARISFIFQPPLK